MTTIVSERTTISNQPPPPNVDIQNINHMDTDENERVERENENENENTEKTKLDPLSVQYMLDNNDDYEIDITKIQKEYSKQKRFCFFKVAANFEGTPCWGLVVCGWCEAHWLMVANINFTNVESLYVDEQGKVTDDIHLKAVYGKTTSENYTIFPFTKDLLQKYGTKDYTREITSSFGFAKKTLPEKEYQALCKAYAYMATPPNCESVWDANEITRNATRTAWIEDQKVLLGGFVGKSLTYGTNQIYGLSKIYIFDTPLLCLPQSTWKGTEENQYVIINANMGIIRGKFCFFDQINISYFGRVKLKRELPPLYRNFNRQSAFMAAYIAGLSTSFTTLYISELQGGTDMVLSIPRTMNTNMLPNIE